MICLADNSIQWELGHKLNSLPLKLSVWNQNRYLRALQLYKEAAILEQIKLYERTVLSYTLYFTYM